MNFNPLTGFKRPHPSAEEEEEPHRAVRARPEFALGQGCSTSGGVEPDGPLPALGNLSAWADSLPSFNFRPDTDWETPPASPTASMELSTILSELQGEPAQGRDIASAPPPASPMTSEALSAIIRELQGEPARERDTASVPVFAGHATEGMEVFDLQGHFPMNRTGAALSRSQNAPMPQHTPQLPRGDEADAPPSPMENLSAWADSLLSFNDSPASTEALPVDSRGAEELFAIQDQPVALQDATTSMSRQGSDAGQSAPAFAGEATGVDAAHQGRQSPRQNPLHRNLLVARERLAAGTTYASATRELNINVSTLANTFDRRGHLLINSYGRRLLQSPDTQVARQVQQLPRALTQADLDRLTRALRDNAGREPWQLHTTLQHSPTPIAREVLEFLIDTGSLRADHLALLPDAQRQALDAAHQGRQSPFQNPLQRKLLVARERLATGSTIAAAARELNIQTSILTRAFDRHGRLLISDRAKALLQSRDATVAQQAQQLPRALTQTDLDRLTQALRVNVGREPSQLHTALQQSPNPVAKEALEFLVDAGGLRADRLAQLPDEQCQVLEAAHQGRQNPLQNPLHRNLLAARLHLAAGATHTAAARELNMPKGILASTFDRRGRLLISLQAMALLRSQDTTVALQAQQLPRALTQADLDRLTQALGDNAGREPRQLLAALQHAPNPVAREVLVFLVDAGGLRADRLALLPDEQRQALDAAHQGSQSLRQPPLHRNLLAARQLLAAGSTFTAVARELNINMRTLNRTFDCRGRLMLNRYGRSLLQSKNPQVAQQTRQLPRALVQVDLDRLTRVLRDNVGREPSQLHTALRNLPNPVAQEALAFLVDAGGLRVDRLAQLPDAQRQALEAAHQGRQSPFQNPLHRNLLAAQQRLAAGATATAVARELNIGVSALTHTFDRHGHLMLNINGKRLLQSRDGQVARQAQQLPRVLTQVDLDRLTQALRDNAGREPPQLHTALRNLPNPVTQEALAFLVDAGGLRADRLALLPNEQRQLLEKAR